MKTGTRRTSRASAARVRASGENRRKSALISSSSARARAEERLREQPARLDETQDVGHLLHELQLHQIELEMQNEELHRAKQELEASREKYFDLYDLAPVGYLTLSEKCLTLEANFTAASLLGLARGALISQPLTRFIVPEDQDIFNLCYKLLFETGTPQACELRMVRLDEAPFWARLDAKVAQDNATGRPLWWVVLNDITKIRQAEVDRERLVHFERLAQVMKCANDIVVLADEHGRILEANDRALEVYGYSLAELRQKTLEDLRAPASRAEYPHQTEQLETDGRAVFEALHQRRDGVVFPVEISARFLQITGVRCRLSVVRDISTRQRTEQELRELSGLFLQAHEEERRQIGKELHDSVAQDLAAVVISLSAAKKRLADGDKETRVLVADSLAVLERSAHDVRDLSHLLHPPFLEEVGLLGALRQHLSGFRRRSGITVNTELPESWSRLPGSMELVLFRVTQEALNNVRQHSGSRTVTVRLQRTDDTVTLEVVDQGHGLAGGTEEEVSGIGITGMRERLRLIGGTLEIKSSDHGTTVRAVVGVSPSGQ